MKAAMRWERRYAELEEFHRLHGHTRVSTKEGGLAQWVKVQRREAAAGTLTPEQWWRLAALDFDWNPRESVWMARMNELRAFLHRHGHCHLRKLRVECPALAGRVTELRKRHRKGKVPLERVAALAALGFDWNPPTPGWETRMDELRAYRNRHGHCRVPKSCAECPVLARWVRKLRKRHRKGKLRQERVEALTAVGFDWDPTGFDREPPEKRWEVRMNELRAYQERHGHCRVPKFCAECPALARWIISVRKRHRKGKLQPERVQALEQMGFAWDAKPAQVEGRWQGQFARLVKYRERFGDCRVPGKWREDKVLGAWVDNQRAFRKRGTLSAKRVAQLESIGFEWSPQRWPALSPEERWEGMFSRLLDYRREHSDTLVPRRYREIKGLRRWVLQQRRQREALRTDWRERLQAIGFRWDGIERRHDEQWARRLAQLIGYRQRFGHCRVPAKWREDKVLGVWVDNQRAFKKKGLLSAERIRQLEAIGFEWHVRWETSADEHWQRMCAAVGRFRQEHGHTDVPPGFREVRGLQRWVHRQREAYHAGQLKSDRVAQLDAIGFAWKSTGRVNRDRWERRFRQLTAYRQQHGHCRVPAKWREDAAFGAWVDVQRQYRKKGRLSPERIHRLDEIGFEWVIRTQA